MKYIDVLVGLTLPLPSSGSLLILAFVQVSPNLRVVRMSLNALLTKPSVDVAVPPSTEANGPCRPPEPESPEKPEWRKTRLPAVR